MFVGRIEGERTREEGGWRKEQKIRFARIS
jgi:hypothetical protein